MKKPPRQRRCAGAGDGNRTHTASLEGWNSTIELHPHLCAVPFDICNYKLLYAFCQYFFQKILIFFTFFIY